MRAHNCIDEGETEAMPAGIPAFHAFGEKLRLQFWLEPRSIVPQNHAGFAFSFLKLNYYSAARLDVLQFVIKEIRDHAVDQAFVSNDAQRTGAFKPDLKSFLRHGGLVQANH